MDGADASEDQDGVGRARADRISSGYKTKADRRSAPLLGAGGEAAAEEVQRHLGGEGADARAVA
jgi:hypothetical protein